MAAGRKEKKKKASQKKNRGWQQEWVIVVRLNSNGPSGGRCVETVADEAVVEKRRSRAISGIKMDTIE